MLTTPTSPHSTPEIYLSWFKRFKYILSAYNKGSISQNLNKFQLFLLEYGQFNANFTAIELNRLHYPHSPFANTTRHTYIRATDTWAMQMLGDNYKKSVPSIKVYPIFLHSNLFWQELERYAGPFIREIDETLLPQLVEACSNGDELKRPLWIDLRTPNPEEALKRKIELEEQIESKISKITQANTKAYKSISKKIIYFFRTEFKGLETLVLCGCSAAKMTANSIMGNLGYRIDPTQALRIILQDFPKLFIDAEQTEVFWNQLISLSTKDREKQDLFALKDSIIGEIKTPSGLQQFKPPNFSNVRNSLLITARAQPNVFELYTNYVAACLDYYLQLNPAFRRIVDFELSEAINAFICCIDQKNLPLAIHHVQMITDIVALGVSLSPLQSSLFDSIHQQLNNFPIQGILLTPYAMRAFVRVFQILDGNLPQDPIIFVTNQSYFEWLSNLDLLNRNRANLYPIRHLSDTKETADVLFLEIHPNNAVESRQFAHDVSSLLRTMQTWQTKPRTLVIDATLNALNDSEIIQMLDMANSLIQQGYLNVILIQSLTKFSQLGLDKRSAGLLVMLNNNGPRWNAINRKLKQLSQVEPVDSLTTDFFSFFSRFSASTRRYIQLINRNARFVYEAILQQLNGLEVFNRSRFQITMSSDPNACYVALNMNGLLPDVNSGFSLKTEDIEKFAADLLQYLIIPLCEFLGLPLTERMSIGFPLSSVNLVFDSIRFTIGLEDDEQLHQYANVMAYTAFVLSRQKNVQLFFKQDTSQRCTPRHQYFKEKVEQFKALTPNSNTTFEFEFEGDGPYNSYRPSTEIPSRQLKRKVRLENGQVYLLREVPNPRTSGRDTQLHAYSADQIYLPIRNIGDLRLSDPRISLQQRRMAISCLTAGIHLGKDNHQNVNLDFENNRRGIDNTVTLASFEMLGVSNIHYVYGPFSLSHGHAYFRLYHKNIQLLYAGKSYPEEDICIRQGKLTTPLLILSLEDREFIFREWVYEPDRSAYAFNQAYPTQPRPDSQYKPTRYALKCEIENQKMIIEADVIFLEEQGLTIFKRDLDNSAVSLEIDYWGEKDPTLTRFLALMTAVFLKETKELNFIARNAQFRHFIFDTSSSMIDRTISIAARKILDKRSELQLALNTHIPSEAPKQYSFFQRNNLNNFTWPSQQSGTTYIDDDTLIQKGLTILREPRDRSESDSIDCVLIKQARASC